MMQSDPTVELVRLRGTVELGDPERLLRALESLSAEAVRRGNDEATGGGYDTRAILKVFFQHGQFEAMLAAIRLHVLDEHEAHAFLDACARELPTGVLLDFAEIHGVAADRTDNEEQADLRCRPGVAGELARRPDATISDRLMSLVNRWSDEQRDHGLPFISHEKTISMFHYVYSGPPDATIASLIEVLFVRGGPEVESFLVEMARTLPWGEDRFTTAVLFERMGREENERYHEALREEAARRRPFSIGRKYCLIGLWQRAPQEALEAAMADFDSPIGLLGTSAARELRIDWIHLLGEMLRSENHPVPTDLRAALPILLGKAPVAKWDHLSRGVWGHLLTQVCPEAMPPEVTSWDRRRVQMVFLFERFRLDHIGAPFFLGLFLGGYYLWKSVLDAILGTPVAWLRNVRIAVCVVWMLTLAITSTTHFSRHETFREKLWMAGVFWGTTLLVPLVVLGISLYTFLTK